MNAARAIATSGDPYYAHVAKRDERCPSCRDLGYTMHARGAEKCTDPLCKPTRWVPPQ